MFSYPLVLLPPLSPRCLSANQRANRLLGRCLVFFDLMARYVDNGLNTMGLAVDSASMKQD